MIISSLDGKKRCFGGKPGQEFYGRYHDLESPRFLNLAHIKS